MLLLSSSSFHLPFGYLLLGNFALFVVTHFVAIPVVVVVVALAFPGVSVAKVFFRWWWVFWLSFSCDFHVADNFGTRLTARKGKRETLNKSELCARLSSFACSTFVFNFTL